MKNNEHIKSLLTQIYYPFSAKIKHRLYNNVSVEFMVQVTILFNL